MTLMNYVIILAICLSFDCKASSVLGNEEEQRVIIRTWYSKPIQRGLDGSYERPESVGHVSLEVPSKRTYLSLWPDNSFLVASPMDQPIRAIFTASYYRDVIQMGRIADSILCLYGLNLDKLVSTIDFFKQKTRNWLLFSEVIVDERKDFQDHNCATIVFSVLRKTLLSQYPTEVVSALNFLDKEAYEGGINQLNDTFWDIRTRLDLLNKLVKNGPNFKAWERSIKEEKILSPYPKISLVKLPDIVTPCSVNLWVRNFREEERSSFMLDLIPAYQEKGEIVSTGYSFTSREEDVGGWSLLSPFKLLARVYWPWSNSYFSEHFLMAGGSFLAIGHFAAEKSKNDKAAGISACIFFISTVNFLYKLYNKQIYLHHHKRLITKGP